MVAPKQLYAVIAGCGRLGSYVANKLSARGHSVVVIDVDETTFDALSSEFSGYRIEGDATEFRILQEAKTDKADLLLAVTHEDNVNLMVAQVAKRVFKVPNVMVRVNDPMREQVYHDMGIDTICPSIVAGDAIAAIAGALAFPAE
jgi:trk system potassium uptake protein TrkA